MHPLFCSRGLFCEVPAALFAHGLSFRGLRLMLISCTVAIKSVQCQPGDMDEKLPPLPGITAGPGNPSKKLASSSNFAGALTRCDMIMNSYQLQSESCMYDLPG